MAEKNKNQVKITIYGYDVMAVEEATKLVGEKLLQLKLTFGGTIRPKTKTRTATTPISPHKHKRAQEKFRQDTHRRVIFISGTSPFDLKSLEEKITPYAPSNAYIELKSVGKEKSVELKSRP